MAIDRLDNRTPLSSFRNLILPAVWAMQSRAARDGVPLVAADVSMDFAKDELQLCVTHTLLTRLEADARDWRDDFGLRLQSAIRLFHRMPSAKAICVDRRRLVARGEKARKEANRPLRKPQKRRFA